MTSITANIPQGKGVYLIHFDTPYKHAKHYMGYSEDIPVRIEAHKAGTGARLMEVIKEAGISWSVSRIWRGASRNDERALKNLKASPKLCPICSEHPRCPVMPTCYTTLSASEIAHRFADGLPALCPAVNS